MTSERPICCSPSLSPSHSGWDKKKNGPLWQNSTLLGKPGAHLHALTLSHQRNHKPRKWFLGTELCCLGGQMIQVKLFFFPSLMCSDTHTYIYILFQSCAGTSSLETWTSTKALSRMSDCLRQYSTGRETHSFLIIFIMPPGYAHNHFVIHVNRCNQFTYPVLP